MSLVQIVFLLAFAHIAMMHRAARVRFVDQFAELPTSLVLQLTDETLPAHIATHPAGTLVHFHVKGCTYCEALVPELTTAVQTLRSRGIDTPIASADAALSRSTLLRYGVTKFPMLLWFRNGQKVREVPPSSRKAAKIIEFVEMAAQPPVVDFAPALFAEALPQLRAVLKATAPPLIVGFESPQGWLREALEVVGEQFRGETVFLAVSEAPNATLSNSSVLRAIHKEAWKDEEYFGSTESKAVASWVEALLARRKRPSIASSMLAEL